MKKNILIGAHVSIAGGFDKSIENGEKIGANCIQIFTKSNRQWRAKPIDEKAAREFKDRLADSTIQTVVTHASYLINLGSKSPETVEKSKKALTIELDRCDQLGIPFLVLHPGTQGAPSEQEALQKIAESINESLDQTKDCTLLLETMAGQGTTVGSTFEQIAEIIRHIKQKNRIGVCLDTCHIFAAGYEFQNKEAYESLWNDFDNIIGISYIKAIHMNDSKKECGSRVDRHEHIGKGKIGTKPFELIMQDERFESIPKILETPKDSGDEDDIRNLELLRELARSL